MHIVRPQPLSWFGGPGVFVGSEPGSVVGRTSLVFVGCGCATEVSVGFGGCTTEVFVGGTGRVSVGSGTGVSVGSGTGVSVGGGGGGRVSVGTGSGTKPSSESSVLSLAEAEPPWRMTSVHVPAALVPSKLESGDDGEKLPLTCGRQPAAPTLPETSSSSVIPDRLVDPEQFTSNRATSLPEGEMRVALNA
jgi:hypothetical protein